MDDEAGPCSPSDRVGQPCLGVVRWAGYVEPHPGEPGGESAFDGVGDPRVRFDPQVEVMAAAVAVPYHRIEFAAESMGGVTEAGPHEGLVATPRPYYPTEQHGKVIARAYRSASVVTSTGWSAPTMCASHGASVTPGRSTGPVRFM